MAAKKNTMKNPYYFLSLYFLAINQLRENETAYFNMLQLRRWAKFSKNYQFKYFKHIIRVNMRQLENKPWSHFIFAMFLITLKSKECCKKEKFTDGQ